MTEKSFGGRRSEDNHGKQPEQARLGPVLAWLIFYAIAIIGAWSEPARAPSIAASTEVATAVAR